MECSIYELGLRGVRYHNHMLGLESAQHHSDTPDNFNYRDISVVELLSLFESLLQQKSSDCPIRVAIHALVYGPNKILQQNVLLCSPNILSNSLDPVAQLVDTRIPVL